MYRRAMKRAVPPFLLLALTALFACGGPGADAETAASIEPPAPPPVPMRALESLLPPSAPVVFRVDLAALRRSAHFAAARDWVGAVDSSEDAAALLALADRTDEVWGAMVMDGTELVPILVARGSYTAEDERRIVDAAEPPATPSVRGGFTVHYRSAEAFTLIGDHTIAIGERGAVEGAIDLQESGAGTGPTDAIVTSGMERVSFRAASAAASMRVTEWMYGQLELPAMLSSTLEGASAALTIDDGLHGLAVVRTSNSFVAAALATLGRNQLAEVRRRPEIEMLGLGSLLSGITLSSEGPEAWARIEVSGDDLGALLASLAAAFDTETTAP
jgi:hypothetical protein